MVNIIVGIAGGYEELMTPLEYNLELSDRDYEADIVKSTYEIEEKYKQFTAFPNKMSILKPEEVTALIQNVRELDFSEDFVKKMYGDAEKFASEVEKWAKTESG